MAKLVQSLDAGRAAVKMSMSFDEQLAATQAEGEKFVDETKRILAAIVDRRDAEKARREELDEMFKKAEVSKT